MEKTTPILSVQHIEKYYGNNGNITKAVDDISFNVNKGEYIGIMGASGSGKTTLLNCVSTIDSVTAGHILIQDRDITELRSRQLSQFRREQLGFIFQDFNLLDTLTAYENIALALTILRVPAATIDKRVRSVAKRLQITDILEKYPYQISGGQKQRVASARAIITKPALILADEPTGALDYNTGKTILKLLQDTCHRDGMTVVLITHNSAITPIADRIIHLKNSRVESAYLNDAPMPVDAIEW